MTQSSIKVDPTLKEAVWLQLQLYLLNGDDVSAMANVDTLLTMAPGCLQGKAAKARLLARAGDTDNALACLDACLVIEPNASFWHTEKAKLYLAAHVALPRVFFKVMYVLTCEQAYELAEKEYALAHEKNPRDLDALRYLAAAAFRKKQWASAAEKYEEILMEDKTLLDIRLFKGIAEAHLGHFLTALEVLP